MNENRIQLIGFLFHSHCRALRSKRSKRRTFQDSIQRSELLNFIELLHNDTQIV